MVHPKRMIKKIINCLTNLGSISPPFSSAVGDGFVFSLKIDYKVFIRGHYEEFFKLFQERKVGDITPFLDIPSPLRTPLCRIDQRRQPERETGPIHRTPIRVWHRWR